MLLDERGEKILCSDIKTVSSFGLPHLNTSRVHRSAGGNTHRYISSRFSHPPSHRARTRFEDELVVVLGMFKARSSRKASRG